MSIRVVWCGLALSCLAQSGEAQQRVAEGRVTAETDAAKEMFQRLVTVKVNGVALKRAVDAIAESASVRVQYDEGMLDSVGRPVTLHADNMPLGVALQHVLAGTPLYVASSVKDVVTIKATAGHIAKIQGIIVGKVVSAKNKTSIENAVVIIGNGIASVKTGRDGVFQLPASPGEHVIQVRAVGMVKQTKRVSVQEGERVAVEFVLEESPNVLDEIVVTGTVAATERRAIPTPITVITAEDIEQRGINRIEDIFRGEVPYVIAVDQGTEPWREGNDPATQAAGSMVRSRVYSRGSTSVWASDTNPLKTYIDGVELIDPTLLGVIDVKSIERIEIVTGPQAATLYGSGAIAGVMQIFTKKGYSRSSMALQLQYGLLESDVTDGRAPQHSHSLSINDAFGPLLSYSANVSYDYTGQWSPNVWRRSTGIALGASHERGPVQVSAKWGATRGANGVLGLCGFLGHGVAGTIILPKDGIEDGTYRSSIRCINPTMQAKDASQRVSAEVSHRWTSWLTQKAVVGYQTTRFENSPIAPRYEMPRDSLSTLARSNGTGSSGSYDLSMRGHLAMLSSTLTLGWQGSTNEHLNVTGMCFGVRDLGMFPCSWTNTIQVYTGEKRLTWGAFASLQLGLWDQLFLTFGLRGERDPNYGSGRPMNWMPSPGIAYTFDVSDATIKLHTSYGRAIRSPMAFYREDRYTTAPEYIPQYFQARRGNPRLGPEYTRGPQFGIEVYFGDRASLSVDHFNQRVTDLIADFSVDSVFVQIPAWGYEGWSSIVQGMNYGTMVNKGWAGTVSLNVGPLSLRGVYSWSDSRIARYPQLFLFGPKPGGGVPSRSGNLTVSYSHNKTNISLMANYVGARLEYMKAINVDIAIAEEFVRPVRHEMYIARASQLSMGLTAISGYAKTNLVASHIVSPRVSLSLEVDNIGNQYNSDIGALSPSLGRQTKLGMIWRPNI